MLMITAKNCITSPNIKYGFFTRNGGVSKGLYRSLNCGFGSGDFAKNIDTNRKLALLELGVQNKTVLTCNQVHSAKALAVTMPWSRGEIPEADGLVTNVPGIVLGILTADCAPVLFFDSIGGIIGAAHAGWKGALNGILEATANGMVRFGSSYSNIKVAIGPCIGALSYEIGPEFWEVFLNNNKKNNQFFTPSSKKGHHMFDLASYIENRLLKIGVAEVFRTEYDTCRDEDLFFSYRRSVKRGEHGYGTELSAITLVA